SVVFKTTAIDHSAIPPQRNIVAFIGFGRTGVHRVLADIAWRSPRKKCVRLPAADSPRRPYDNTTFRIGGSHCPQLGFSWYKLACRHHPAARPVPTARP